VSYHSKLENDYEKLSSKVNLDEGRLCRKNYVRNITLDG